MPVTSVACRLALALACVALARAPAAAQYSRVTTALGGAQPNGVNGAGVLSADGRFVAFESEASNLVAGDTNASTDIFVRDLAGATTTRVSLASDGLERAGDSGKIFDIGGDGQLDISDDGRYVVFTSRAALAPGDAATCPYLGEAGNCPDIYVRDRQAGTTTRISVAAGGGEPNGPSREPKMSGDGRWIVYESDATNLVAGDTNGVTDVFRFDRQSGTTARVSVATGGAQADQASLAPTVSDNGTIVAFVSASALLSAEPDTLTCERGPPACQRAFVVDRVAGTTRRVPAPPIATIRVVSGASGPVTLTFRVEAEAVFVAPDGASVAVNARATANMITNPTGYRSENWIVDRTLGRVTFDRTNTGIAGWDGRRLTYGTYTLSGLVIGSIGVVDTITGVSEVVATVASNALAFIGNLSADGRYVLVQTTESKVAGDTDAASDLYVLDRDADGDGIASAWETLFGLDPADAADAAADPDGDGLTNLAEFQRGSHPKGLFTRYLAEGAANEFFATSIALLNPNAGTSANVVVLRYLGDNGRAWAEAQSLPAGRRGAATLGARLSSSFSTVIESEQPIVADRIMTWGGGYGSHAETSMTAPSTTWFLAEGATHGAFQLFYLLQNPGSTAAHVDVTYLRPTPAPPLTVPYVIAPEARLTIPVDAIVQLAATDVSARLVSDVPILVERAMYMNTANPAQVFGAGHAGAGVTAPGTRWFVAEGATGSFFDLYYLIANPSAQATRVRVSYLLPAGAPLVKEYQVAAESRLTISVDGEDARLLDTPVSAILESLDAVGIVVERSMWWPGQGQWQEGHLAAGSTVTARRWALAAGHVGGPEAEETYILIANTSNTAGTATLRTIPYDVLAGAVTHTVALAPNSRVTVAMSQFPPLRNESFGIVVETDGPEIVVERAMYSNADGIVWAAGSDALGTPLP